MQFIPFAVVPAILFKNPDAPFVTGIVAVATGSALLVEILLSSLRRAPVTAPIVQGETANGDDDGYARGARRVSIGALAVLALAAATGYGSYGIGIGTEQVSPLQPLLTPLRPWSFIAVGLYLYGWREGKLSRKNAILWIVAIAVGELLLALSQAIIAPGAGALFSISAACVLMGLTRARTLIAAMLIGVLVWPTIADIRNQIRLEQGVDAGYARDFEAGERLRMDRLMGLANQFDAPIDIGQPSATDTVRYGLVPRLLDPDRPPLSTGALLNVMMGGTLNSSYTFMLIGNIWIFDGYLGLVAYFVIVALLVAWLYSRRMGPAKSSVLVLAIQYLLWMGGTYPESLIGFFQALVSFCLAWLVFASASFKRGSTI